MTVTLCLPTTGMRDRKHEVPNFSGISSSPYDISSFSPPGVNIINNMMLARFHRGPSALTYEWFYQQVRLHGPWDYKTRIVRQYENFGNFHYGAVGTAAGISASILLRAAG